MTPIPPHDLTEKDQLEYIQKFLRPDDDSTTVSVQLDDPFRMLESLLEQISQIMLDEYQVEEYETLILNRFEQNNIVRVWYLTPNGDRVMTFYETLDPEE